MREIVKRLDHFQLRNRPARGNGDFGALARNGWKLQCKVDYRAPGKLLYTGSEDPSNREAEDAHPDHHVGFRIAATWKTVTRAASFFCNNW